MVDASQIREHMEVLGSDGKHVGTVDHLEGESQIKLAKKDPSSGGKHHFIPASWIDHVDSHVHLNKPGADAKKQWQAA